MFIYVLQNAPLSITSRSDWFWRRRGFLLTTISPPNSSWWVLLHPHSGAGGVFTLPAWKTMFWNRLYLARNHSTPLLITVDISNWPLTSEVRTPRRVVSKVHHLCVSIGQSSILKPYHEFGIARTCWAVPFTVMSTGNELQRSLHHQYDGDSSLPSSIFCDFLHGQLDLSPTSMQTRGPPCGIIDSLIVHQWWCLHRFSGNVAIAKA